MFIKSLWMHPGDLGREVEDLRLVFLRLAKHGFTKIFLFVKNSDGSVIFRTKSEDVPNVMKDWAGDPLRDSVKVAHDLGIELHPTFVVFCEGNWKGWGVPSEPGHWLSKNLDMVQYDRNGNPILRWADPAKEKVKEHETRLILEVLRAYDADGIQLDYIRYPEEAEGCFCEFCRTTFMSQHGIDPKEVRQPDRNMSNWIRWRAENVTGFVRDLRSEMKRENPKAQLSAAVFKDYPRCLVTVAQDWPKWTEEALVDFVCPMTYEYDLRIARYLARNHRCAAGKNSIIYEGLGKRSSQSSLTPSEVFDQAIAFKEEGANGITIFSYSSLTNEDLERLDRIVD